jgi:hypothetical protein
MSPNTDLGVWHGNHSTYSNAVSLTAVQAQLKKGPRFDRSKPVRPFRRYGRTAGCRQGIARPPGRGSVGSPGRGVFRAPACRSSRSIPSGLARPGYLLRLVPKSLGPACALRSHPRHIHASTFGSEKPTCRAIVLMTARQGLHAVVLCLGAHRSDTPTRAATPLS